ncbi:MAG: DUF4835 domain-containing protein [Flavobacteriales bacterium]|nr:DUF4835 domain-containing protein [Flavobacteriales bacterium]MBO98142.1 DUF4835 domain-containing protein [Flavobacteriales bacterium]|tara:strand:+ start:9171 stop:10085 length:915 start_codon:yes stop_codon:yes gene_type:complete
MLKKTIFTYLILISSFNVNSQEILCNVRVNSSQVQISDRKIFQSMQTAIYEFINNTKWTNANISSEERIECSILINISNKISNDEYEGSMQIQSTRPIYGTSYKSTLFNFMDNNIRFKFLEYQSLEFSETSHLSNLTSIIAFYVNIILGLDFATFSEEGGNEYFNTAQKIVNNAQNARESGWKAFESDKNRYWIAHDLLDNRYNKYHMCLYRYHRIGLDKLAEEPEDARYEITESIESLRSIYRENPSALLLKLFFDAKADEITKIYSESFPNEKARIIKTLTEIDPSNSTKYQTIAQEESKER